jgi:8-oxo-dGTP pyrophosphatase MutT (NUDIX family)
MKDADVVRLLGAFAPFDAVEEAFWQESRDFAFAPAFPSHYSRKNFAPGHINAAAFILNSAHTHTLLVHHAKLSIWVQPGGHVELDDATLVDAAVREAREETGQGDLHLMRPAIFDIDAHDIPANPKKAEPAHRHFDIRFLFETTSDALTLSDESTAIQWVALDKIPELGSRSLTRMAAKAQILLGQSVAPTLQAEAWKKAFLTLS